MTEIEIDARGQDHGSTGSKRGPIDAAEAPYPLPQFRSDQIFEVDCVGMVGVGADAVVQIGIVFQHGRQNRRPSQQPGGD